MPFISTLNFNAMNNHIRILPEFVVQILVKSGPFSLPHLYSPPRLTHHTRQPNHSDFNSVYTNQSANNARLLKSNFKKLGFLKMSGSTSTTYRQWYNSPGTSQRPEKNWLRKDDCQEAKDRRRDFERKIHMSDQLLRKKSRDNKNKNALSFGEDGRE
jgi:hypothetical protein